MIIGDNYIYLELQKSGCTHIRHLLTEVVGDGCDGDKHNVLRHKPRDKYVLGSVRNPWAWYVSLWAFGCNNDHGAVKRRLAYPSSMSLGELLPGRLRRRLWDGGRSEANKWRALYQDAGDRDAFREWLNRIHDPKLSPDLRQGYDLHAVRRFLGFFSYRYCKLHLAGFNTWRGRTILRSYALLQRWADHADLVDFMVRNEYLCEDLIAALDNIGQGLSDSMRDRIRSAAPSNTSDHKDWRWYYDDQTRDLVARRDRFIIERHGYTFDGASATDC
jgi:hypothetical protein